MDKGLRMVSRKMVLLLAAAAILVPQHSKIMVVRSVRPEDLKLAGIWCS